jgi:hypothetical protein
LREPAYTPKIARIVAGLVQGVPQLPCNKGQTGYTRFSKQFL